MQLQINDSVTWRSAAGLLRGKIINIVLSENGYGHTVPWIDIKTNRTVVRLCATKENLSMMCVNKINTDQECSGIMYSREQE